MKKIIFYVKFLTNFGQNFRKTNEWGTLLFRSSFKAKTPDLFCIILRGGEIALYLSLRFKAQNIIYTFGREEYLVADLAVLMESRQIKIP